MPAHVADDVFEPIAPTQVQKNIAMVSSRRLGTFPKFARDERIQVKLQGVPQQEEPLELPVAAVQMLARILAHMAKGEAVSIVPSNKVLTTNEAADLINVSRPYLIKLLDTGKIPCQMVGSHRRIQFSDLIEYKRKLHQERSRALDKLAELSEEYGLGE